MTIKDNDEIQEDSTTIVDDITPIASRAQSSYSAKRTKLTIAPIKCGENRIHYLWRLLRCSIRRTIDAVARADDTDIERSHGLHFIRNINHDIPVKCISFNSKRKEIVSIDHDQIAHVYHSDGRAYKKLKLDIKFNRLFYCVNEDEFIAWSNGRKEVHMLSADLEILSTSTCDYNIFDLNYNETTSDVFTCGKGGATVWQFRFNRRYIVPKFDCREGISPDLEYNILAAEQTDGSIQRLFITAGYDVLTFNIANEGRHFFTKQDLHVRPIVAMTFIDQRDVLVTAGRDGSIKVWDNRWFILYAYVGHQDRILYLSKHPFGPYLISSSQDRTIRVWSFEYGDVVDIIHVPEPISHMNIAVNYEKFIIKSAKCLQLWCVKHYCDFLTFIGSPISKILCTSHPNYPIRSVLLCKDSTVRIVACITGDVLTSLVCDLNFIITSCAYAIAQNTLFVSNGNTILKADTSLNPCKIIQQFDINEYTINCLVIYEYIAQNNMEETPALKALVTKPSSEIINNVLKGFSRTLLIAGLSNGHIAVLKWDTGEIDFSLDMHSTRPVVDIIANSSADQIITCGVDLIIRIWRVFPYAVESLAVTRSIFCALPPIHLTIMKNSLAVAFRDEPTMTHSLMLYNLDNNERFDHPPDNDHCDKVTAISGCSKLKLIATGSLDGTLRIWNGENQLIRMIVIHDNIHSLHFINDSGDLIIGIGDHLYAMSHLSYLPKVIVFKTISMQFTPTIPENKASEEINNTELIRMSSENVIRLKKAHKADQIALNSNREMVDAADFHIKLAEKVKIKNQELEKLEKRDLEIAQIAEGKLHRTKKYKISSKVRKQAFDEYMKMYLKEPKKGLLDDDMYKVTEQELFGPSPTPPDPYTIDGDNGFFRSLKEANSDPLLKLYDDRGQQLYQLQQHYRFQSTLPNNDIHSLKQQQEQNEAKKLLESNLQKLTLPSERPHYGSGTMIPNSVLAKLLWPDPLPPRKQDVEEWTPPTLSDQQLQAIEETQPVDEEAEWRELMASMTKKRLGVDDDDMTDRSEKKNQKDPNDLMKQLTGIAQQTAEPPQPIPSEEEPVKTKSKRQEVAKAIGPIGPSNKLARQTSIRRSPSLPPVSPAKPPQTPGSPTRSIHTPGSTTKSVRTPVKPLTPYVDEPTSVINESTSFVNDSTQTVEFRSKTPREFSPAFLYFIDKLVELNWFAEQYPLIKVDIFLETCDEDLFPTHVLQRLDMIISVEDRLAVLHELEDLYRSSSVNDQTRDSLIDKILTQLTKFNPLYYDTYDIEFISTYLRLLVLLKKMSIDVVGEFIYWYLEGGDRLRPFIKHIFEQCGLQDSFNHFYNEMDSWKLWELDLTQSRRSGIKTLAHEWLRRWAQAFRTHIGEMHSRLKNGDVKVKISNATSRALTGDTSLSKKSTVKGKKLTVTLNTLPRLNTSNISSIEIINYFVEMTQDQINEQNKAQESLDSKTVLVLPTINKQSALGRLGESHTIFHRPVKRNPIFVPYEHRFEPGELSMGRYVNYPVRKLFLDPFRRQIFTEDIEYEDNEPYLLTLKLAPKFFLPILSQVTKS
ncbi:unnamed protein product [Adineta steineri]|uniref:Uncharacterized protein n=2 Tax=Adineta steineri TaxID=433720 RepID=A0A814DZG6_9BILA|nr:unnamed protein product [Adineta steineri]CAF3498189.1 unnamed protein product [Adineta steineri]